ncbi:hypothetical protein NC653_027153 [Populus alba x Populus x berolinensis]|uniref:Uncharacterized protein n=1 Tax=Populus alba x Populus x berolinensis TaxID=444605 RepID=A0AAD6M4W8_9ROSI|nr:hypothetical protein NC653_027153 [Populus alba x Populus x berolinensis]
MSCHRVEAKPSINKKLFQTCTSSQRIRYSILKRAMGWCHVGWSQVGRGSSNERKQCNGQSDTDHILGLNNFSGSSVGFSCLVRFMEEEVWQKDR